MAEVMAQQRTGLSAPASRQDVVSALLSAYGNSFGHGDASPSSFSPVPADKELPPPPPRSDSLEQKPLPAVQRAEQRMSMKFQLRAHEDTPASPTGTRTPRRKILYRSLSREAKPPSLTLTVSNGSTAIVPPTPALPVRLPKSPAPSSFENKSLPSPPPPPPVKSDRRPSAQRSANVGLPPKPKTPLARNDSLLSQGETKPVQTVQSEAPSTTEMAAVVKRKALPLPAVRKFKSLAELGAGPRAGKGGPMPPTSAPRPTTSNGKASEEAEKRVPEVAQEIPKDLPTEQPREVPTMNEMPPTPEEEKPGPLPVPAPPRKVFVGMGLPSNPRAKGGPISPKHVRGKSSTGFNVLKAQRPAPPIPTKQEAITPEMTPSPELRPNDEAKMDIISPLSPLPPPTEQRRPFSFEAIKRPEPAPTPVVNAGPSPMVQPAPPATVPVTVPTPKMMVQPEPSLPQRPTSMDLAEASPSPRPSPMPALAPTPPPAITAPSSAPLTTIPIPELPPSPVSEDPPTPPPFTPLTRQPIPMPATLIPAIAPSQLRCYTKHSTSIWSNNTFQPMGCMICHSNDKDRKWTCTWCRLRICRSCSEELSMVPGRNLGKLLEAREEMGRNGEVGGKDEMPEVVVSGIDDVEA